MPADEEEFLRYYQEELLYLRRAGKTFAHSYPKIAARLELHGHESPDPHVERLIESFAFLTARIQSNLDDDFTEIGAELLDVLYPQYLLTVPSLAIARFDVSPKNTTLTSRMLVPRLTKLFAPLRRGSDDEGAICRWRTTAPVTLWPIEITEAELESPDLHPFLEDPDVESVLRLRLFSHTEPFDKLGLDRLRFHLHGDTSLTHTLYELLLDDPKGIVVVVPGPDESVPVPHQLPHDSLGAGGFGDDEELLPYPPQAHPAYLLLQEYFTFPEKFHFIDVGNLAGAVSGKKLDLLFLLGRVPPKRMELKLDQRDRETGALVESGTFALGCTPIVNLFEKTSEPIRIDHRHLEYRLVGDTQREKTTEIHSVLSVSGSVNPSHPTRHYEPFYSWSHDSSRRAQRIFWHARRERSLDKEVAGTETWLSFVDLDFNPEDPPEETVWAHTLCTNRSLAAQMPAGALLQTDVPAPGVKIVSLRNPTPEIRPPLGGRTLWSLVSQLSLNYLSLSDSTDKQRPLRALREILRLYCTSEHRALEHQLEGLKELKVRKVVRRFGDVRRGFARGTEVTITVDDGAFVGGSAFLFMSMLNRFFSLYASTNSFTQLVVRKAGREGAWIEWQPMAGGRVVL